MRISDWSSDVCSSDLIGSYEQLNGLRVAVKLKVEKGTEGYDDKNRVAEYLTPNPASPGNKGWVLLSAGQYNTNPNATQGAGGASGVGADRKSVVEGKSVSVRVDRGGRRIIKKKQTRAHKSIIRSEQKRT